MKMQPISMVVTMGYALQNIQMLPMLQVLSRIPITSGICALWNLTLFWQKLTWKSIIFLRQRENLNIVRSRVNASTIDSGTQEQLRQIIREERWRELHFEMTELYDIRRWGEVQSNFEEHPLVSKWYPQLSWDEKFLLYPIPSSETSRNTNIKQNNGW